MTNTVTRQEVTDQLERTYLSLQELPTIRRSDVFYWALDNLQRFIADTTNKATLLLPTPDNGDYTLSFLNGVPRLELRPMWLVTGMPDDLAEVDTWLDLIPHAQVKCTGKKKTRFEQLTLVLTLDLREWPSLARGLLWHPLYYGLVDNKSNQKTKKRCLQEAAELLATLWPTVTMDSMRIAAELGMIDKQCVLFPVWFQEHCASQMPSSQALPDNFKLI